MLPVSHEGDSSTEGTDQGMSHLRIGIVIESHLMPRIPFKYLGCIFFVWLFCDLVNPPQARTDWINLTGAETAPTIAEIYVLDDHVKVVLEVYIRDLPIFDDLVPDDWVKTPTNQRLPIQKRLQHFSSHTLQLRDGNG